MKQLEIGGEADCGLGGRQLSHRGQMGDLKILGFVVSAILGIFVINCGGIGGGPEPQVVGVTARENFGLVYGVTVICDIRNDGEPGSILITAKLSGGGAWTKNKSALIGEFETRTFEIEFPEPSFMNTGLGRYEYSCEAR